MAGGVEGERSRGELSSSQHPQPQQVESHQGSPAESVLASLRRENLDSEAWSHTEMVALIKREMAQYVERHRPSRFDPVAWMREQLTWQVAKSTAAATEKTLNRQEMPHAKLLCAWDAVSPKRVTASFTLARNDAGSAGLYHLEEQQLGCGRPSYRLTSGRSRAIHHDRIRGR
jgi:hypothetical protein